MRTLTKEDKDVGLLAICVDGDSHLGGEAKLRHTHSH